MSSGDDTRLGEEAELELVTDARRAVDYDPVRLGARIADARLAAAVLLSGRVEVCEALLAGVSVPARRLHPAAVRALGLDVAGELELDYALALRVLAIGPFDTSRRS